MAKRERKNARLQTNFKAETQPVQAPAGAADDGGRTAEPATAATTAEASQPGGTPAAAGPDQGSGTEAGENDRCPVCDVAFKVGDTCATDIELGICHAACLEGSPTVDLNTGDPIDGPIATYPYAVEGDPAGARVDAARAAAVNAYLGTGFHIGVFDQALEWDPHAEHFVAATTFVQAERGAPAEAIPIQLALKKLGGSMSPQAQEVMLWSVFRDVFLRVHDHLKAIDDAEAAKAAAEPSGGMPLDRALQPQAEPFAPEGFRPRV